MLEFALILPSLVAAVVLLVGTGYTLVLRQEGLTAARYAAFFKRVSDSEPTASQVSGCVSPQGEQWQLSPQAQSTGSDIFSLDGLGDLASGAGSTFGGLVSNLSGSGAITYTATTVPTRGMVPRVIPLKSVEGVFTLPTGTWTSDGCGNFSSVLTNSISIFTSVF